MSSYFTSNNKNSFGQELKDEFASGNLERKKEAIKKVIAQMTVGKNVSCCYTDVLKCLEYSELEMKKLVYLYIINYSRKKPDQAIMVISLLRKDVTQGSPIIKALALRTMGCLRVPNLTEYLQDPLKETLNDPDAYVRKASVMCIPKVYELNQQMIENSGMIEQLKKMLKRESNPQVISSIVISLIEIQNIKNDILLIIDPIILSRLLFSLNETTEWGQIFILDCLANYIPKDSEDTEKIIDRILPRLQHINPSVVFSTIKVLIKYLDYSNNIEKIRMVCQKIQQPLITLLNSNESEIQYIILKNIPFIIQKKSIILENQIKSFFCKFNEPNFVKQEKLDIIVKLTNSKNYETVLNELQEYSFDVDEDFQRRAIKAIGYISIQIEPSINYCIDILLQLMSNAHSISKHIINESLIAIMNIYRKYPTKIKYKNSLQDISKYLNEPDDSNAKAASIWIIGDFAEEIPNSIQLIEQYIKNFKEEERKVQLSLINATVKVFLKFPDEGESIIQLLLYSATNEIDDIDVRDRAYIYWRMLSSNPYKAKEIVLSNKPQIKEDIFTYSSEFLDCMINNMSFVSSILQKVPEQLFKETIKPITNNKIENQNVLIEQTQSKRESENIQQQNFQEIEQTQQEFDLLDI